jgi:hypothetical protein
MLFISTWVIKNTNVIPVKCNREQPKSDGLVRSTSRGTYILKVMQTWMVELERPVLLELLQVIPNVLETHRSLGGVDQLPEYLLVLGILFATAQ